MLTYYERVIRPLGNDHEVILKKLESDGRIRRSSYRGSYFCSICKGTGVPSRQGLPLMISADNERRNWEPIHPHCSKWIKNLLKAWPLTGITQPPLNVDTEEKTAEQAGSRPAPVKEEAPKPSFVPAKPFQKFPCGKCSMIFTSEYAFKLHKQSHK